MLSLHTLGEFFSFFLSCFLSKNLPDIPMVYVTYSLSLLPSVQPSLIGPSSIGTVRFVVVVKLKLEIGLYSSALLCVCV